MKVFIVYCHPSDDSFTKHICDSFIKGIVDSGNEYILSDLYKMGFDPTMSEQEYLRDAYYRTMPEVAGDVLAEQEKSIQQTRSPSSIRYSGQKPRQSWWAGLTEYGLMGLHTAIRQ